MPGKRPRPRRGGGGDGLGGDPCGRPRGLPPPDEGRPQGSPLHSPTSPAPTGTKGLLPKNLPVRDPTDSLLRPICGESILHVPPSVRLAKKVCSDGKSRTRRSAGYRRSKAASAEA